MDTIVEFSCSVRDMTAEELGFAVQALFAAGAVDAYTAALNMGASASGAMLCVLCRENVKDATLRTIFTHTNATDVRENCLIRSTLNRRMETVETLLGSVRKKVSAGYGVTREKFEYDDLSRIARENGSSIMEARAVAVQSDLKK